MGPAILYTAIYTQRMKMPALLGEPTVKIDNADASSAGGARSTARHLYSAEDPTFLFRIDRALLLIAVRDLLHVLHLTVLLSEEHVVVVPVAAVMVRAFHAEAG